MTETRGYIMNFFDYTSLEDSVVHGLTLFERILPLLILSLILFLIIKFTDQIRNCSFERVIRIVIAALMLIGELSYMVWNYYHAQYDRVVFYDTLPFHLCSYAIWGLMIVLIFENKRVYKTVFVFGIISVLALLFPNLNHGFNSFRYYQLFFSHSFIMISMVYLYRVHSYYPNKKDLIISFYVLQVIIVLSLVVNIIFGTSFLYIGPGNKPIDFAWEWPWHMIEYEFLMILFYISTYFVLKKGLHKKMD